MLNNNILGSNVVQEHGDEVLESVIGLLSRDPIAILSSLVKLRKLTLTIRDAIFLENFQNYLIRLYDNRTSMTKDGTVTNYTYNSLNQLTQAGNVTYTWDNAGNLVSQASTGTTLATYSYDSRNRMTAANVNSLQGTITETYTYDYLGNRASKTTNGVTTEYGRRRNQLYRKSTR